MEKQLKTAKNFQKSAGLVTIFLVTFFITSGVVFAAWRGPTAEPPDDNRPGYIWNSTNLQSDANFNISGNGTLGGTLISNSLRVQGTTATVNNRNICVADAQGICGGVDNDWVIVGNNIYHLAGTVGIGIATPSQKLEVDLGNILVQGTGSFDTSGEEAILYLGDINHYIKSIWGSGVRIGTYGAVDGITLLQTSGNVGIGTTNPGAKLEISAEGEYSWAEWQRNPFEIWDGSETLYMGADNNNNISYIQAVGDGAVHSLALQGRGGNVGVGETNPTAKLFIRGSDNTQPYNQENGKGVAAPDALRVVGGRGGLINEGRGGDGGAIYLISGNGGSGGFAQGGSGGDIHLTTGSGGLSSTGYGDVLLAEDGGNVAIGTGVDNMSSIPYRLTVTDSSTSARVTAAVFNTATRKAFYVNTLPYSSGDLITPQNASLYIENAGTSNYSYQIRTRSEASGGGPSANFVVTDAGRVGIGTTVPSQKLDVLGIGEGGIVSNFVVTDAGRVGIGTTSPFQKLHIVGNTNATGIDPSGLFGQNAFLIVQNVGTTDNGSNAAIAIVAHSGAGSGIQFADDDSSDSPFGWDGVIEYNHPTDSFRFGTKSTRNKMILDSDGRLGVGSVSPQAKLEVAGDIRLLDSNHVTCDANHLGLIRYYLDHFEGCRTTGWVRLDN